MKLNSRKRIDPVMPDQVSTGGAMNEDVVNEDNLGLYKNLNERNQYLTYNSKKKEVSVMEITRDRSRIIQVVRDVSLEVWMLMTSLMKEYVSSDDQSD